MDHELSKLERTLRVYLERGEKLLKSFASSDLDDLEEQLLWRNAAFHNFVALDHKESIKDPDYHQHEPFTLLIKSLAEQNQQITQVLSDYHLGLGAQLSAMRYAKSKLNKFKSVSDHNQRIHREV